jgi:hypothetical protein
MAYICNTWKSLANMRKPRELPSEGKGQKFESSRARQLNQWVAQIIPETPKRQTHHKLTNRTGVLACDRRAFRHIVALN